MSIHKNENYNSSEKTVLNLEMLNIKYNNLLIQYKQAVANYVDFLHNSSDSKNIQLTNIKGQSFWGTGQAGNQAAYTNISNVNSCAALCLKTPNCTGATFNPTSYGQPLCWLRSGDGNTVPSNPNDHAIVAQDKLLLLNIQTINSQLTNINNQILHIIDNTDSEYASQTKKRTQNASHLLDNYNRLNQERIKIEKKVNEYQDLDETQNVSNIKITQNYYSFLLLLALAIIIVIILYQFSFSSSSSNNDVSTFYYILFFIILLGFFIYYYSFFIFWIKTII
jgi:hypothetical protein